MRFFTFFLGLWVTGLLPSYAQQTANAPATIVPDGNTQTSLSTNGSVTGITTATVQGNNAYNSFSLFSVNRGTTVNLFLPNGTDNLLNLVNLQSVNVDGILNSIKNGKIGGHVFFADPFGIIIGSTGVINVGAFSALTPTKDFMNQFFSSPGVPSSIATVNLINGTVPITPDGLISIQGKINAIQQIQLWAGKVVNGGTITSGAVFSGSRPDFSDIVNTSGLQTGAYLSVQNGEVEIRSAGDFENSGTIATNGGNNLNAGNIDIQAGGNVKLDANSLISASGQGQNSNGGNIKILSQGNGELDGGAVVAASGGEVSGNGGSIEFSAKGTLNLAGGVLKAGALSGTPGTVLIDPTDLVVSADDTPNDGSNLHFTADNSITVNSGVTISSRQIGSGTDALNSPSTGNSGSISLTAPQITVNDRAQILANATNGFFAGDITMTAAQTDEEFIANAQAGITIGNATLEGGNITLLANATANAGSVIPDTIQLDLSGFPVLIPDLLAVKGNFSVAKATIQVGGATGGNALIDAVGDVKINSHASSTASTDFIGVAGGLAGGFSHATATTTIGSTASIQAPQGSIDVSAITENHLSVKNTTGNSSGPGFAASIGVGISESTAQVDGTVTAGADVKIESQNTNDFLTKASGGDFSSSAEAVALGAGLALGFYQSTANTTVNGSATGNYGDVKISATSTNTENLTGSSSKATDKTLIDSKIPIVGGPLSNLIFQKWLKLKPQSNPSSADVAPAVSLVSSTNTAETFVNGGSLTAHSAINPVTGLPYLGNVEVSASATDAPQISAAGSAGGAKTTLGGSLALASFSNTADAEINGNTKVMADAGVNVHSDAIIPNPASVAVNTLVESFDFTGIDFSAPRGNVTGILQSLGKDAVSTFDVGKTVLDDLLNVINPGFFLTSFTNTALSKGINSNAKAGLAGSVDLLTLANKSNAWISGTANVTAGTGDVDVNANSNATTLNAAGMAFSLGALAKLNPGVQAGSSLGGSYVGITLDNESKAYIGDNTTVKATKGSVNVGADTETFALNVYQSGDNAEKLGITGAFSSLDVNDTAESFIASDATVTAGTDVGVTATNNLNAFAIGGALGVGGTAQVGVTTAWNTVNDSTLAYIGDPSNSRTVKDICAGCGVTANRNVNVNANSKENVYAISLAASKSGASGAGTDGESSAQPAGENAPSGGGSSSGQNDGKGGQYGFGVSANIAFNEFVNDTGGPGVNTQAFINNGATVNSTTGDIGVAARDDSFVAAVGVSGALGQTAALAGALSWNNFDKEVDAFTTNSTLSGNGLNVGATNNGGFYDISAGGGVNTQSGVAIAGSVNKNTITNNTNAYVGGGTIANNIGNDGVTVASVLNDTVVSFAGGVGLGTSSGGVGAAVDIGEYTNNTWGDVTNAQVNSTGNVTITANTMENLFPIAFSGALGENFGVTGSVTWETLNNDTEAFISGIPGQNAVVYTPDDVLVASDDTTKRLQIAGDISLSGNAAIGISADVNHSTRKVLAYVNPDAVVDAGGNGTALTDGTDSVTGLRIHASQGGYNQLYAAGGAGAGDIGVAGSAVVNLLNDTTTADIAGDAEVNQHVLNPSASQNVEVLSEDVTDLLSLGGAAGVGTSGGGVGAGADVTVINKDTESHIGQSAHTNIGQSAHVKADGNVKVQAVSTEDLSSLSGSIGGGGSVGIAGAASVYIINNKTKAFVDSDVFSEGSVLVSAQNDTDLDSTVGGLAIGLAAAGVGASAAVDVITKDTEAWIGSGANVTALGLQPAIQANDGKFTVSNESNFAFGEVPSPPPLPAFILNNDNDPALQSQRLATPETASITGVVVTAVSTTSNKSLVVAGGGSGSLGASISSAVTVANLTTKAYVAPNAQINVQNDAGAGSGQSVLVAAGSDYYHMAMLGAASLTGSGAVGPAVDVAVASNNTSAYVDTGAQVDAAKDISVVANGAEDFLSLSAGLGGSLFIGAAGSVSVTALNDQTYAYLAGNSTTNAGGNVLVSANDATKTDSLDGALAVGFAGGGVGGSVAVTSLTKDTQAYVGGGATVNAGGNSDPISLLNVHSGSAKGLVIQSNSSEDLFSADVAGAGGLYGGVAGAVSVENVHSNTSAYIGGAAKINHDSTGASSSQAVNVEAKNTTTLNSYDGALAIAAGGIAGGVDVGIVNNNTSADIGNGAEVSALGGVGVSSNSSKLLHDHVASAGVGVVSVPGAVSVFAVDNKLDSQSQSYTSGLGGYADSQSSGDTSSITGELPASDAATQAQTDANNASSSAQVTSALNGTTIVPAGTSAFIGDGASVTSGGYINVNANQTLDLSMNEGTVGIGGVSIGASVGVANVTSSTQAYVGKSADVSAQGNILVSSILDEGNVNGEALNGVLGAIGVGGAKSTINDASNTAAYVDSGADVSQASTLQVSATDTRSLSTDSSQGAIGAGVAAAGLSFATSNVEGSTKAYIAPNATVGADSGKRVQDVQVTASSNDTATANTNALAAGITLGSGQLNIATAEVGSDSSHPVDTEAYIGDGANVNSTGSVGIDAGAQTQATATANGVAGSVGLSVGGSLANATATPTVKAYVGKRAAVQGGQDISIAARYNYDSNNNPISGNDVSASSTSSTGGLVGGIGSSATATSQPTVEASGGDISMLTSGNDTSIMSLSNNHVSATANGNAYGVLAGGLTSATATIMNMNTAETGTGAVIHAGDNVTLSSQSTNVISNAKATGGEGGLLTGSGTTATANLNDLTAATLGSGSQITVPNDTGSALLEALSSVEAHSNATDTTTIAIASLNEAQASTNVTSNVTTTVGDNATIQGGNIELDAKGTKFIVDATSNAGANGVAVDSTADSYLEATSDPKVDVDPGAAITGANGINIVATLDPNHTDGKSDASAKIVGATGHVTTLSDNNLTLNSEVDIDAGSSLTTSNLDIEVMSPNDKGGVYEQTSSAEGDTVVNYITTTTNEVVDEVFGWIPFIGPLIEQVTKTITTTEAQVLGSDVSAKETGAFNSNNAIHINGTIYEQGSSNPTLVVDQNGNIQDANGVSASVSPSAVTVNNLTNTLNSTITLDAPAGLIDGNLTVHRDTVFPTVTIINNSSKDLFINNIQPEASNGSGADLKITAATDNANINFISDATSSAITIQNNSSSNIFFGGFVNNPSGTLAVTNANGSILGDSGNLLELNGLSFAANHGSVGGPGNYLNLQLQSDDATGASLSVLAGRGVYMNAGLVQDLGSNPAAGYTIPGGANINFVRAGGDVNLNLAQPTALVNGVDQSTGARTVDPAGVNGIYNVGDVVTAGGDVNLNVTGAPLDLYGLLKATGTANITDTNIGIFGAGSGQLIQANGINLSALDGQIGSAANPIQVDLKGGNISANAKNDIALTASAGDLDIGSISSSAGNALLAAPEGDVIIGDVHTTNGDTHITAFGSIFGADVSDPGGADPVDIVANNVTLTSTTGSIGQIGDRLVVNNQNATNAVTSGTPVLGGNSLDMYAFGDIYAEERSGDLISKNQITSNGNGNVNLLVTDGSGWINQINVTPQGNQAQTNLGASLGKTVVVHVQGSLLDVGTIANPDSVTLEVDRSGGVLNVAKTDVFRSLTAKADYITLANVVHLDPGRIEHAFERKGDSEFDFDDWQSTALNLDVTGPGSPGHLAKNVNITVNPCSYCSARLPVIFSTYSSDLGSVTANVNRLEFFHATVGTSATFQNNFLVDNIGYKFPKWHGEMRQHPAFYLLMIGDDVRTNLHRDYFSDVDRRYPTRHDDYDDDFMRADWPHGSAPHSFSTGSTHLESRRRIDRLN